MPTVLELLKPENAATLLVAFPSDSSRKMLRQEVPPTIPRRICTLTAVRDHKREKVGWHWVCLTCLQDMYLAPHDWHVGYRLTRTHKCSHKKANKHVLEVARRHGAQR